ncbi:radical SAM protein [Aquella oligotrophica]|uniref:Radical SAM protein n=1 Tax=Aquella oligotrophica TaxID=2067065 RepID=A0A2I7N611_9NEIS|nr:radical SAM protein [Aquella oligotrophica]AUR51871.1 radical SAM protein [Aquella oligotrophica]
MTKINLLTFSDHSRHFKECVYVYPVVSRRAQGVSLGINLNINNACNWRCVYCQVEGLVRGKPDSIDLDKLEHELDVMLEWIIHGDFIITHAPAGLQRFNDICLSGNGESTLSKDFMAVTQIIAKLRKKYQIGSDVKTILISNGSEMHLTATQEGLKIIAENNGELWFKIDRVSTNGIAEVNQVNLHLDGILERLKIASAICPTWIQSCWFKTANIDPAKEEVDNFIELIHNIHRMIKGVLIYSTARNPALPEGDNISQVSLDFLAEMANRIESFGIKVKYYQ